MKLVAGHLNNVLLESLHATHTPHASAIIVAVAYADNHLLPFVQKAVDHKVPLTFYGRYDESHPIKESVIDWFLKNKWITSVQCLLVADYYHPKLIWWKGRGVYIGSANMTNRAWFDNVELGTFFDEDDIQKNGLQPQLESIVAQIHTRAHPINNALLESMKQLADATKAVAKARQAQELEFSKTRWVQPGKPLTGAALGASGGMSAASGKQLIDEQVRNQARGYMEQLAALLTGTDRRPAWMPKEIPAVLQVDQFLYAYDDQFPENRKRDVAEVSAANRLRHREALEEAVVWWHGGAYRFDTMLKHVETDFPFVRDSFSKQRILSLAESEFIDAYTRIHAVQERGRRRSHESLGFVAGQPATGEQRLHRHAQQVFQRSSPGGKTVLQLLEYVLWKDSLGALDQRIYNGSHAPLWAIPDIKENTLGDILGWVRPDVSPPINGRTYKALAKLGYDIPYKSNAGD